MPELRLRGGEVDGLDLHYIVAGRGPAVVLVHGLGGFAESWRHTTRALADRTTVYALDLPGFGASAKPPARYRLSYFASALHGFMEVLGIREASLVGHSLGAAAAVTYALTHPARVERLALVGGVVPGFGYRPSWIYRLVALPLVGETLSLCRSARLYKVALARCFDRPVREEVDFFVDFGFAARSSAAARAAYLPTLRHVRTDFEGHAPDYRRPLRVGGGRGRERRVRRLESSVHSPSEEVELRTDGLKPEDEIVVYCHQGVRSAAVADYLRQLGFKNVENLLGGLDHWARTVDPTMRRY